MTDLEALILLNQIPELHAHIVSPLLDAFDNPAEIFSAEACAYLRKHADKGVKIVEQLSTVASRIDAQKEIELAQSVGVALVSFWDETYPPLLREITDPPVLLYVKGKGNLSSERMVSVVGSRNATTYGREMAKAIARDLALAGVVVVSGMAEGIDGAAHKGALDVGKSTVAVLGTGIDVTYPKMHAQLANDICENGCLVSEYCFGMQPLKHNFPRRNRIITGMTKGTVVVEAATRSGSLITARLALDYGRDVLAVPGQVGNVRSEGTNNLIKQGAGIVTKAEDVLEAIFGEQTVVEKSEKVSAPTLSSEEQSVIDCLDYTPCYIEVLGEKTGIGLDTLFVVMAKLETAGSIKKTIDGGYIKA